MSGAGRAAMKITFLRGSANFFAARSAIGVSPAGGECFENGVEVFHDVGFAADHLAVAAFEAPDAATGADVTIVNALRGKFFGAADVVDVIGVAAVDDDVAGLELAG